MAAISADSGRILSDAERTEPPAARPASPSFFGQTSVFARSLLAGCLVIALIVSAITQGLLCFLVVPIVLLGPLLVLYVAYIRYLRQHSMLSTGLLDDMMARMFGAGFLPGAFTALIVEGILVVIVQLIVFPNVGQSENVQEEAERQEEFLATHPGSAVLHAFLMAFIVAALVEESVKALIVRWTCCFWSRESSCCVQPYPYNARSTMALFLAASIGFSSFENVLYTAGSQGIVDVIVITVLRSLLSTPLHAIAAAFTAVGLTKRDQAIARSGAQSGTTLSLFTAMGPAILVHGVYDFVSFLAGSITDNLAVQVGMSLGGAVAVVVIAGYILYRQWGDLLQEEERLLAAIAPDAVVSDHPAPAPPPSSGGATAPAADYYLSGDSEHKPSVYPGSTSSGP